MSTLTNEQLLENLWILEKATYYYESQQWLD